MDSLNDITFKKMFRLDRLTFEDLLDRISSHVKLLNEVKVHNSSGRSISLKNKLAVTIRWLAGGSYLDLCFAWGVAFSTFYHPEGVLWPTLEAIDKAFPIGLPIDDPLTLEELSKDFHDHSGGILDGCIMAFDGFGVQKRQPFNNKVERPKDGLLVVILMLVLFLLAIHTAGPLMT